MKKIIIALMILTLFMTCFTGCSSWSREMKSFESDLGGGLYRKVTVYDYNGQEIQSWTGKFDVSESENEVFFDVDGKRVIIHGGIIINEEIDPFAEKTDE